jgi:endonuclease/exonuclease/phosphatase family metal-dependent hydrolase
MGESLQVIPEALKVEFDALGEALTKAIPPQDDTNILIATWNIKEFGSLTRSWFPRGDYAPKRDFRALRYIAEIIKRFDVVAIQEITGDLRALRDMMKCLGENWSFLMTDVTKGKDGGAERLGFVFNNERLRSSGLACEVVLPPDWQKDRLDREAYLSQFVRTPYAVSFLSGSETFILLTAHIDYGDRPESRIKELEWIARWMRDWATKTKDYNQNLILLGDFNIDRKDSGLWKAFTGTGLHVPDELNEAKRSIFVKEGDDPRLDKFYDQIAWFRDMGNAVLSIEMCRCGTFDFLPFVYRESKLPNKDIQYRISDHYPLWCCFKKK